MRAVLHDIDPDHHRGWDAFVKAERAEPWDHFEWFTVSIGPEGDPGSEYFQVCISTPAAVSRASGARGGFRGLVVDSFEPEEIRRVLHDHVASLNGLTWEAIRDQLRQVMRWEYEGMAGT